MDDISDAWPIIAFIVLATIITILIAILRFIFKRYAILWKSTLMSFIFSLPGPILWYIGMSLQIKNEGINEISLFIIFNLLFFLLVIPGMCIYAFLPGAVKPCPSNFDLFGILTCGFLFYILVFWGRNKYRKHKEEMKIIENKNIDAENQTPTENNI